MPDGVVSAPRKNLITLQIKMEQGWDLVLSEDESSVDLIYKEEDWGQIQTRLFTPKRVNIYKMKENVSDTAL
eukprot:15026962-Ditylum_brightwellii.AAC.2